MEKLIVEAMRTGGFQSPEEVIGRALEYLQADGEAAEKIDRALGQFERGEYFTAEHSRADMSRRKEEWLRDQKR